MRPYHGDCSVQSVFPTERCIDLIEPETFAEHAMDENASFFVAQTAAWLNQDFHVDPSGRLA